MYKKLLKHMRNAVMGFLGICLLLIAYNGIGGELGMISSLLIIFFGLVIGDYLIDEIFENDEIKVIESVIKK